MYKQHKKQNANCTHFKPAVSLSVNSNAV